MFAIKVQLLGIAILIMSFAAYIRGGGGITVDLVCLGGWFAVVLGVAIDSKE